MFNKKVSQKEFTRDVFDVAENILLGAYLCSNINGKLTVGKITELEAYVGAEDKASHAYPNKKTDRNAVMFDEGGKIYVFFVYGMHHQFNVVTNEKNTANAILIRSLEPVCGIEAMMERRGTNDIKNLTTGPGKLCKALGITKEQNGLELSGDEIWISPKTEKTEYILDKRIGIDYAEEYKDKLWRYILKGNKFISRKPSLY